MRLSHRFLVALVAAASVLVGLSAPARAVPVVTANIEDTSIGTGLGQVSYSGIWTPCGGCTPGTPNNSFHYSNAAGAAATIRFTGTQLRIVGVQEPTGGYARITIDGTPSAVIDTYVASPQARMIWSSQVLINGNHTAVLTNVGQRNPASTGNAVIFDQAQALTDTTLPAVQTIEDSQVGTQLNQVAYAGAWTVCGGCTPATPNNSFRYSGTAGATATIRFSGTGINIFGIRERQGGIVRITIDDKIPVNIDTFAPTSSVALWLSSGLLADSEHTATILNTGQHTAGSTGNTVGFDRAVVQTVGLPTGNRSGQPWLSGVNGDPTTNPTAVESFCSFRHSLCDLAHVYPARDSWSSLVDPNWVEQNFASWPGRLLISTAPFPENSGASLATCATGAYDGYWRTFGSTLNSTGRQDSIIRMAWQANGNWFEWSASNATDYVNCWRHIATAIKATADPDPMLDWSINAHYSQDPPSHNPLDIYPGDAYVDSIGLDAYDAYPESPTFAAFTQQAEAVGGITWLYNFARSHGKPFGIGEWGVASGSDDGGGDSANYIQWMRDWMSARAGNGLLYEAYFNNCEEGNIGSNIFRPLSVSCFFRNPMSAARYVSLWQNSTA